MFLKRRWFLQDSLFTGAALVLGCSTDDSADDDGGSGAGGQGGSGQGGQGGAGGAPPQMCEDLYAGGTNLGMAAWGEPITTPLNQKVGGGLGARLFHDLAALTQVTLVTPNDTFYIRTEYPASVIDPNAPWQIQIQGLVSAPVTVTMNDLNPLVVDQGVHLLECSGNFVDAGFGLLSAAQWAGVPLQQVLDMANIDPQATRVLISGFDHLSGNGSVPGASWVFTFDQLTQAGAFLATEMNGAPLPQDHGFPVRILIPGWFGCCNIKWVNEIRLVDDSEPATSQMQEFASRTLQNGTPALARDYIPATIDQTAVPVLVEKWQLADGAIVYRMKGVMWGGYELTDKLAIQFDNFPPEPVTVCPQQSTNATWTLWEHMWRPNMPGSYRTRMVIDDPNIPQRRLDSGRYDRTIIVDQAAS